MRKSTRLWCVVGVVLGASMVVLAAEKDKDKEKDKEEGFVRLFPQDGEPQGWLIRPWDDVNKPADPAVKWIVKDGILNGGEPRGRTLPRDRSRAARQPATVVLRAALRWNWRCDSLGVELVRHADRRRVQ